MLNIKVRNPYSTVGDLIFTLPVSATVLTVKTEISKTPSHPSINNQRLIYAGRMLRELDEKLADFLPKNDLNATHTFHLIINQQQGARNVPTGTPVNNTPNFVPNAGYQPYNLPYGAYPAQMPNFNPAFQRAGPVPAQPNPPMQPIFAFQINFSLLIKLAFLVLILSQGAGMSKLILFTVAALVIYLYQTGRLPRFGANPPEPVRPDAPHGAPTPVVDANNNVRPRNGLVEEVKDIIFPFVYSLFPGWQPPVAVNPNPANQEQRVNN